MFGIENMKVKLKVNWKVRIKMLWMALL